MLSLKRNAKVRMWQEDSVLTGTSYVIEIKKWFGWIRPSISYSEDSRFYSKEEADRWFDHLSSTTVKRSLVKTQ